MSIYVDNVERGYKSKWFK